MLSTSEFANRACRWFGRKTRKVPLVNIEARQVLASGLFDSEFYCRQLKGRPDEIQGLKAPLRHYLFTGGFEGLDPSPAFDSDWYLAAYPDVRESELNPLVHYLQHGLAEGRLPAHGARPLRPAMRLRTGADLYRRLWGGFHHLVLPELRHRASEDLDHNAAWYLCGWEYVQGDMPRALHWLQLAIAHAPGGAQRRHLVALSKCYTGLNAYGAIRVVLEDAKNVERLGNTLPYVRANSLCQSETDAQRMDVLNEVFEGAELAGIARRDAGQGWSLDNLAPLREVPTCTLEMPLVSVVIPAYNAGSRLEIALDSLLEQSWTQLEIIVVDDGSKDNTAQIANDYATRDSRVQVLINRTNQGAYASRNNGMRAARGEFVTVHDSDDWSHPQKLERQMRVLLEDSHLMAVGSNWVRVNHDMCFVGPWLPGEAFLEPNVSSWIIRRSVLDAIGCWDEVSVAADSEFLWRLEHHYGHDAMRVVLPDVPLSFALSDEGSLTRSKAGHVKSVYFGLRRLYREGCRWWHREAQGRPVLHSLLASLPPKSRPFPVPLGITREAGKTYDCVVVADFTVEGQALEETLKILRECRADYEELCLLNWPDYNGWLDAPIADEVLTYCHEHGLHFAHWGLTLRACKAVLVGEQLWRNPPSDTVRLVGIERVENGLGELCEFQDELLNYFRCGGIGK